jgi:hypothetical protein
MKDTPKVTIKNLVAFTQDRKQGTINFAFEGLEEYDITEAMVHNKGKQVFITIKKKGKHV